MGDESIGDRADHGGVTLAELRIQHILQPDHVGFAIGRRFIVHAVIRSKRYQRTERSELAEADVEVLVEALCRSLCWRVLVLNVIG